MKILRVIPSVNPAAGGPIEGLLNSSGKLLERGHTIEVVSLDYPEDECVRNFPYVIHALGETRRTYGYSPGCRGWLLAHVRDYDVVVIQGIWQYHAVAAARACRNRNVPYVVFTHGMLDPWFRKTYPLKHLKKLPYWFLLLRGILRHAKGVIFTTDEERLLARQSFPLYQCNEVVVSYGTTGQAGDLAVQKDGFLQAFPQLQGKHCSLFLGRIHPKKGVDILIEAFAAVYGNAPERYLVIVGPDETGWQKTLQAMADRLGVGGRVVFTGLLRGDMKWGACAAAECFVLPSHQENFGISVAEALSAGLPVLISNKVNIYREIVHDRAGLASEDTAEAFAGLLQQWQGMDVADKQAMGIKARQCFLDRFEISRAAQSLEEVLLHAKS